MLASPWITEISRYLLILNSKFPALTHVPPKQIWYQKKAWTVNYTRELTVFTHDFEEKPVHL